MTDILRARVAAKHFDDKQILRDIDISVGAQDIVALVGPSGCGKSTLLRIIAGLDRDFDGIVTFDGRRHDRTAAEIGFIFQEPRLFPWLTVADNIAFSNPRSAGRARIERLLADVGLSGFGNALPKQLSGGQAQRASIARGLYSQPRLLLLDEPFSAVDAFTRMKLQDLIVHVARQYKITLILVTHDIDEALFLSDRVLIMNSQPGEIRSVLPVPAPRPRDRRMAELTDLRASVLTELYDAHAL